MLADMSGRVRDTNVAELGNTIGIELQQDFNVGQQLVVSVRSKQPVQFQMGMFRN